jgi:hypothetical protein
MSVLAARAAEAVVPCPCPRRAPDSQPRLSLALASRRLRSRFQHWTALTIDHHLALDTLVMRSSSGDMSIGAGGWLFWADQDCGLRSDFSGLICGLIRVGSGTSAVGCQALAQAQPDPTERV